MRGVLQIRQKSLTGVLAASLAVLAACSDDRPAPQAVETDMPEELAESAPPALTPDGGEGGEQIGTPMAERVATLGLLNKRNNVSQDIELKPGESRRFGDVIVRLSACERTKPWETPKETGAFVQVLVRSTTGGESEWGKVFSGWLFKNSPSLNVVEHRIYDVWVKDCAMSFPGEVAPDPQSAEEPADASDENDDGSE